MGYKPKYLESPDEIAAALEQAGYRLEGKGRPDTNSKVQIRFRSVEKDLSVSFSVVPEGGEVTLENGHSHHGQDENYLNLKGRVIVVTYEFGRYNWYELLVGDNFTVPKGVPHNTFIFPGTITVVSKYGKAIPCPDNKKGDDWWGEPVVHDPIRSIPVEEAERLAVYV